MSVGFFSSTELAGLRESVAVGLVDDIDIYPRTANDDPDDPANIYEDSAEPTFDFSETVKGWIFSEPNTSATTVGGIIGTLNTYRIFLPVGTEIHPGDRLLIRTVFYELIDTVDESTWLPVLRCSAKRLE